MQIEACSAGTDGGAIYALVPVMFVTNSQSSSKLHLAGTTIVGNVAGANGGGIAAWATLFVDFGHPMVVPVTICIPMHLGIHAGP